MTPSGREAAGGGQEEDNEAQAIADSGLAEYVIFVAGRPLGLGGIFRRLLREAEQYFPAGMPG